MSRGILKLENKILKVYISQVVLQPTEFGVWKSFQI